MAAQEPFEGFLLHNLLQFLSQVQDEFQGFRACPQPGQMDPVTLKVQLLPDLCSE